MPELHALSEPDPAADAAITAVDTPPTLRRRVSVMVVDDQALFRSGLVRLLEDDQRLSVVALSAGGWDVPSACAALSIDVVVTDLELSAIDGIELTRSLREAAPDTRVLILTAVADSRVVLALASGAAGFLLKDADPEAIRSAVVSVFLGDQVLCQEAARWLVEAANAAGGSPTRRRLTRRETEVLRLVATGTPNRAIATHLGVGDKTVRNYVSQLYRKLALRNRTQIAMYARHVGITERNPPDETRALRPTAPTVGYLK
jgi:DNA-binding NarL/FixJ family response regulator